MICCRPGGLPKGAFVEEYLGEVYTPWRWFERQDSIKKLNPDGFLPDFYNIQIERPKEDALGYGVIFVEAIYPSLSILNVFLFRQPIEETLPRVCAILALQIVKRYRFAPKDM